MTANFFDLCMLPLEQSILELRRLRLIGRAEGAVLEIGAGTGANLPFYDWTRVSKLYLTDLRLKPRLVVRTRLDLPIQHRKRLTLLAADTQALPFADSSFDSVVATLTFCTVPDAASGIAEIMRVLKPSGTLVFIEHVNSSRPALRSFMRGINAGWRRLASGCNLTRDTAAALHDAGFRFDLLEHFGAGLWIAGIARKPLDQGAR